MEKHAQVCASLQMLNMQAKLLQVYIHTFFLQKFKFLNVLLAIFKLLLSVQIALT